MKSYLLAGAATMLLAGCISTDWPAAGKSAAAPSAEEVGVNAQRGTGSNLTRATSRDVRQGMDRDDLQKMQRSGGSRQGKGMGGG